MNHENFFTGSYYQNNYTQEQNQNFAKIFDQITSKMVNCLDTGRAFDSSEMQQAVREHYEFCSRFWQPNAESYKSLAMSYILPTEYRETYENYRTGLGKYIYDAVVFFADENLAKGQ